MANEPTIRKRKVSDYIPDPRNANTGTERGQHMLDRSVARVGLARSIVAAADGTIPAGNKTLQAAVDAGIENVIEVDTDGNTLVVVKRTDWDTVEHPQAREYAYFDNRVPETSIAWDAERILEDAAAGVDLAGMFHDEEIAAIIQATATEQFSLEDIPDLGLSMTDDEIDAVTRRENSAHFPLAIVLSAKDVRRWQEVKARVGYKDDTRAFLAVVEYLESLRED